MSRLLESYVAGSWYRAADEGEPLYDAVTGEVIARLSATGLDRGAMVRHAREIGGPAVRALTFHERAAVLKEVAAYLAGFKEEFYEHSYATGATKRDAMVDVDGGIGTLPSFASKGRRELPNDTLYVDGATEQLGRAGTFVGQHVYTSRPGVVVQINAFNFPVWGMLEKLAPTFLAGLPTIVKPAPQGAWLAEAVVRRIVESGLMPQGSLQLLCGSPDGLLDELGLQDTVAFTGSAATGALLRQHPRVVHGGVRLAVEADSLNCSVLGPDVTPEDPEFDLYVKAILTEMTVKAGQKCTAIRRAIVPAVHADAVIDALSARLAGVTVGNPADESVRMGALVSTAQRDRVRDSIRALSKSADIVFGDPDHVEVVGADAKAGAFISPVLLKAHPGAEEPHDIEPFGPVATVFAYHDLDEAIALAVRGKGSLVGSLVTHDPVVAREVVLGIAPYHGRLLVLDREDGKEAATAGGHGSPLPVLVHGGPGRAGGGEELGGIRAVLHLMQRSAIEASPDVLTAITGTWTGGAKRHLTEVHPFRKSLAELAVGDTIASQARRITLADIEHFAEFTGDTFYAHTDPEAAAANPLFGGIVAHGYLVVSIAAGLFVDPQPGPVLANFGVDNLRFLTPVKAEDTIAVTLTVKQITPRTSADYGEVRWDALVTNQRDEPVATYDVLTLVAKTTAGAAAPSQD